ncbi:hypothetical protein [Shewanella algae]|uniref:hypothetical protein n=1 Tax=Shewanella algae TaxID=38313 RepID=UPI0031F570BB
MVSDSKKPPLLALKDIVEQTNDYLESIAEAKQRRESGFYEVEGVESETVYCGWSMRYAALGMAYALQGSYFDAQEAFLIAAKYKIRPLEMAFVLNDPEYVGLDITEGISAHNVIECACYSIAAGNVDIAKKACALFREHAKTPSEPATINEFAFALDAFFKGELGQAANICETRIEKFLTKPSKKITFNSNYYTLHLALWGICTGDQQSFDEGIRKQLTICHHEARYGEWKGMVQGHYAEYAVALTNLAILAGLKQQVFDPFIPQGLVWSKSDRD